MWLVKWAKADDRASKSSLEVLCETKSLKEIEQRCGVVHPDFLLRSH